MYIFNYLEPIDDDIKKQIYNERLTYQYVYEIIENIISKENIIIGGSLGINLLLKNERTYEDFIYELYSEKAFINANNISNELDKKNKELNRNDIIMLKTSIPNSKYMLYVNNRVISIIYHLGPGSNELIVPVSVKSFDNKTDVLVLSPEIQLIDIYRNLYSPSEIDNWEKNIIYENKLYLFMTKRIEKGIIGALDIITINDRKKIEIELLNKFIKNNKNVVLIGEHAYKMITKLEINTNIIQIISENNIESDFIEIKNIINHFLKKDIFISYVSRDIKIMQDNRIVRTSIKIGTEQKEIMYIYNVAKYDLIPFNLSLDNNIQIANPFVILRFLLIDFWVIRIIKKTGSIDEKYAHNRLNSIIDKLLLIRSLLQDTGSGKKIDQNIFDSILKNSLYKVFQSDPKNYIGFYEDENIAQKNMIKDLQKKYYDYYPSLYLSKMGSYRLI